MQRNSTRGPNLPEAATPVTPAGQDDETQAHGPDLVVDSVATSPSWPQAGERVWFDVSLKNTGDQDAKTFNVVLDGDGVNQKVRIDGGLPAGAERQVRMGPLRTSPFQQQAYWIHATVDSDHEVAETREDNNTTSLFFATQPPFPPMPPMPPIPPPPPPPHFLLAK